MERILNKRGTYVNVLIARKLQFSYSPWGRAMAKYREAFAAQVDLL